MSKKLSNIDEIDFHHRSNLPSVSPLRTEKSVSPSGAKDRKSPKFRHPYAPSPRMYKDQGNKPLPIDATEAMIALT